MRHGLTVTVRIRLVGRCEPDAGRTVTIVRTVRHDVSVFARFLDFRDFRHHIFQDGRPIVLGKVEACECFIVGIVAFRESEENATALVGRESLLVSLVIWLECSVGRYCSAIVHLGF